MKQTLASMLGRHRSAGVPVSAKTHHFISLGNESRAAEDWSAAAENYAAALTETPTLYHIWIQLGHAHKRAGALEAASFAYAQAEALDPADGEPTVEQGNVAKMQGSGREALVHYTRAFKQNPSSAQAYEALRGMLSRRGGFGRSELLEVLQDGEVDAPYDGRIWRSGVSGGALPSPAAFGVASRLNALRPSDETQAASSDESRRAVVFDASDLLSYFRNARLPTGIQRVQIATISSALSDPSFGQVHVCNFSDEGDSWVEAPVRPFLALCALSVVSGEMNDDEWLAARRRLDLVLALAEPFRFPDGALLVNLGTSWWLRNYFLFVRQAKELHNVRYVPFVHDFIPIMTPEHCVEELVQDFVSWALGAFQHADFFLVNSEATKKDLLTVAARLDHRVDPAAVTVVPLDADFRSATVDPAPTERLRRWGLTPGKFVLIVSTIESRKNHIGALDAWLELIERHGASRVPKLVCVGNRGWLNDAVYRRLESDPRLKSRVVMLSALSDAELSLLYLNCRFTLYPSNYEGWGLPVTESLCYGKVPLVSDSSSLPEAGGAFRRLLQGRLDNRADRCGGVSDL
ncbi:MAG: glycosyltransferase [Caulobacteraceae bacterium]